MQVIIPLAGLGTRLRPHTYTKPKPLINVAGKAVMGHILDKFAGLDVGEFLVVHGYLGEQIRDYVTMHYPQYRTRFIEQREINGQAPAILLTREFVRGPVLIVFVDTLFEADLSGLEHDQADAVVYVKEVDDPRRFGVAVVGPNGQVMRFVEKPESCDNRLAVIGVYYIKDGHTLMWAAQELLDGNIQTNGEYFLADALNLMIQHGAKFRTQTVDVWEDCGNPETVLHANRYLLEHGHDNSNRCPGEGYLVIPPVNIAVTAAIRNSVIGPYATISDGCHITGSVIRDSIIEQDAEIEKVMIEHSLVGQGAVVRSHYSRLNVGDSSVVELG